MRASVDVTPVYLRRLFWARPLSPEAAGQAAERIADYDVDRLLLDSAVKSTDGFFTTFFVSPYSKHIARWAARRGLTPNQVTTVSMLIGALAAAAFATGERWGLVAGAVLLQISFTTDCVDGQLARYTRQFSKLGAWLDSVFDRTKEYLAFAGLAIGAAHAGDPVWLLACAAITLQTVRHTSDFSYMAVAAPGDHRHAADADRAAARPRRRAGGGAAPGRAPRARRRPRPGGRSPPRVLGAWRKLDRARTLRWLKRMAAFPIGERFAVDLDHRGAVRRRGSRSSPCSRGAASRSSYTQTGRILRSLR